MSSETSPTTESAESHCRDEHPFRWGEPCCNEPDCRPNVPCSECRRAIEPAGLAETLAHALHSTRTAQGWYGAPECEEVGRALAPHVKALMAQAWEEATSHVARVAQVGSTGLNAECFEGNPYLASSPGPEGGEHRG